MKEPEILKRLAKKEIIPDNLAEDVLLNLDLLPEILKGVSSPNPQVKFGCAKILRTVSKEKPEELYTQMDFFIELLDSDNNIIKWNAIDTVANLTNVDDENQFDEIVNTAREAWNYEDTVSESVEFIAKKLKNSELVLGLLILGRIWEENSLEEEEEK